MFIKSPTIGFCLVEGIREEGYKKLNDEAQVNVFPNVFVRGAGKGSPDGEMPASPGSPATRLNIRSKGRFFQSRSILGRDFY